MLNLDRFVAQRNQWLALFSKSYAYPLTQTMVDDLARDIDAQMSPENLHQDGEATVQEVMKKRQFLTLVAQELEVYAQRNGLDIPSFSEV